MDMDVQQTPFVKQLAANDRPSRDKAISSLRIYLTSGRAFTPLELLKIWRGLFFSIWHTDRPIPQQNLSKTLSSLLLALPLELFIPFLTAFWTTMSKNYSSIPSLRMDKYLLVIRHYIASSFLYLSQNAWSAPLVKSYLALIEAFPLSTGKGESGNVPDGLRYHVLDVWVDGILGAEGWEGVRDDVMGAVNRLEREGKTKVVRRRAEAARRDERVGGDDQAEHGEDMEGEVEWGGITE